MATRGRVIIGGRHYYVDSDAYPTYAGKVLRSALRRVRSYGISSINFYVISVNKIAGRIWLQPFGKDKSWGWPAEEFRWIVNLKTGKVSYSKPKPTRKQLAEYKKVAMKYIRPGTPPKILKALLGG